MTWMEWYNSLTKPSWTPSPSAISLIWTILYPIILTSFGFTFVQTFRGRISWKVAVSFAINLIANMLFMPIFAGLRNVPLATVDILIVWATIIWSVVAVTDIGSETASRQLVAQHGSPEAAWSALGASSWLTAEEIAKAILFLASDESSYMNAENLSSTGVTRPKRCLNQRNEIRMATDDRLVTERFPRASRAV